MKAKGYLQKTIWLKMLCLTTALIFSSSASAVEEINATFFGHLAISGYDPVAYFTEQRPVEGSKQFEFQWKGAKWRFSSKENLELFKSDPEHYAPQYGGYCAYAVATNTTADIDPTQFTLHEGKLYLNYNKKINKKWLANRDEYILEADKNWPNLLNK
ncbi:MAG: YHS domain-containing protein [Pseudomonadales bacterium]|nr:YHS domain-containing protein [Pseudomonadales bacterium]